MKILSKGFDYLRNNIIPATKKMFSFKNIRLERQPSADTLYVNLVENTPGIKSQTFKRLLSPEFTPKSNMADNGARITTVLDKKTQKPVEVFVARVEEADDACEKYCIMVKDKEGDISINGEQFKNIGETYFYVNEKENMITPKFELTFINNELYEEVHSYMKSLGNDKYAGIGIRLHQLRVERMLQNKLGNVCIVADGNSFPFHYDMGYRLKPEFRPIEEIQQVMAEFSAINKKPMRDNAKFVAVGRKDNERVICFSESLENCLNDYYKNGGEPLDFSPNMYLDQTSFNQWLEMVQKQPILF